MLVTVYNVEISLFKRLLCGKWSNTNCSFTDQRCKRVYLCPFSPVLYLSHHINICPLFTHQIQSNNRVCSLQRGQISQLTDGGQILPSFRFGGF